MYRHFHSLAVVLLMASGSSVLQADVVTVTGTGKVTVVTAPLSGDPSFPIHVGDPFTFSFSYDNNPGPPFFSSPTSQAWNETFNSSIQWSYTVGATTAQSTFGDTLTMQVLNNESTGQEFFLYKEYPITLPAGWSATGQTAGRPGMYIDFSNNPGSANDAFDATGLNLPDPSELVPANFDSIEFRLMEFAAGPAGGTVSWPGGSEPLGDNGAAIVDGTITSLTEVPEPGSLALLAMTGAGAAAYRWRRRRTAGAAASLPLTRSPQ